MTKIAPLLAFGLPSGPDIIILILIPFLLSLLILPIWATIVAVKSFEGSALPLWLFLSWVFPIAGPLVCIIVAKKQAKA